jgi:hypothetical protein
LALADFATALAVIAPERDRLERHFIARIDHALEGEDPEGWRRAAWDCWREAEAAEARWLAALKPRRAPGHSAIRRSWARLSQVAAVPKL